ncbi:MAG: hypothetical protein M1820_004868 [Bogoriella megaspora]|nr:MAG: hypothetical protein M1820_004868 [Bogoriella megaspora]
MTSGLDPKPTAGFSGVNTAQNDEIKWSIPPSRWTTRCHPLAKEVTRRTNAYFLDRWPFENDGARNKFLTADYAGSTCLCFPLALDDRIEFGCKLLGILFLVDDQLEDLSLSDGDAYNSRLMTLGRGEAQPDPNIPVETMMHELWEEMRQCDRKLAIELQDPVHQFMKAQTSQEKLRIRELGQYLAHRQTDVGQEFLAALMRFVMAISLTEEELQSTKQVEKCVGYQIAVVNDIYSFEKERRASQVAHKEGGWLCSSVNILSQEVGLDYEASKRILWLCCREYEAKYLSLAHELRNDPSAADSQLSLYLEGLQYHMSGNEVWSRVTTRYTVDN